MKAKPFLRWAGSKKKLIPELTRYWDESYGTYLEPFVGSGQLCFAINSRNSVISDVNGELINTYEEVKKSPAKVKYFLDQLMPVTKERYYELRENYGGDLSKCEKAAVFIFLNRYCFNGLYRTNNAGKFNVPYSNSKTGNLPSLEDLSLCAKKLAKTKILQGDFEDVIKREAKSGDFVYLDPPYAIANKRIFSQYGPSSFGQNDLERLKRLCDDLDEKGVHFLLSYAYTKESVAYFQKWNRRRVITQRNISGFSDARKKAAELLITNISRSNGR